MFVKYIENIIMEQKSTPQKEYPGYFPETDIKPLATGIPPLKVLGQEGSMNPLFKPRPGFTKKGGKKRNSKRRRQNKKTTKRRRR
jgi:hypothetical protein